MVNNSFSFLLFFIMCVFRQDQKNQQDCFFTFLPLTAFLPLKALFTFLLFYLFTFKSPFTEW